MEPVSPKRNFPVGNLRSSRPFYWPPSSSSLGLYLYPPQSIYFFLFNNLAICLFFLFACVDGTRWGQQPTPRGLPPYSRTLMMCSITSRPPARRVHHINLAAAAVWFSSSLFPPLLAHWWRHYVCLNLFIPSLSLYVHDRAPLLNVLCMDSHFLVWSMAAYWSRSTLGNSVCAARLNIISLVLISPLGRPGNEYTSGPCTYTKCLGFFFSLSL